MAANRNGLTVLASLAAVAAMVGLVAASVPLYRLFCDVTGYGGATRQAAAAPGAVADRSVTVRFDANVVKGVPWRFRPAQPEVTVRLGEETLVAYVAENLSDAPVVGTATFNVTPAKAGQYFVKVECFCFTEQRLEPGQRVEMPVSFYVDPAIAADPHAADIDTITLSYTFFRAKGSDAGAAAAGEQANATSRQDERS